MGWPSRFISACDNTMPLASSGLFGLKVTMRSCVKWFEGPSTLNRPRNSSTTVSRPRQSMTPSPERMWTSAVNSPGMASMSRLSITKP